MTKRPRVLLVDEDHDFRAIVSAFLKGTSQYEVVEAASLLDAQKTINDRLRVDIVLADLFIPNAIDADIVNHLKSTFRTAPTVIFSDDAELPKILSEECLKPAGFLSKFACKDKIVETIERALGECTDS